jgi:uncharacterized membrane protein
MESKVTLRGHPIHPMVIVLPLGLLPAAVATDIVHFATHDPFWARVSFWLLAVGTAGGLLAGVIGFLDWRSLPAGSRASRVGAVHGLVNLGMLGLFGISLALRLPNPEAPTLWISALAWSGLLLSLLGGWLGGELVYRLRVGIQERKKTA